MELWDLMLSKRQAETEMAEALKAPLVTVTYAARRLKEARLGLWASPGRGTREIALEPAHLINLAMAMAVGDPGDAPENVAIYRNLELFDLRYESGQEVVEHPLVAPRVLGGLPVFGTLGETLDAIVERAASTQDRAKWPLFFIDLSLGAYPEARLSVMQRGDRPKLYASFHPAAWRVGPPTEDFSETTLTRTSSLWNALFFKLADIWRASLSDEPGLLPSNSGSAPLNTEPENENAETPGRVSAPTRNVNRPRSNAAKTSDTLENREEREISQPSEALHGRSLPQSLERPGHVRHP